MLITDQIAKLIEQMIEEGNGSANVQRNDLAQSVGCVPSQISYVISSRFTPERGYKTESRRGGGGYIRIVRV
ncbi:MAG: CtsR family transcriptional regulator, partial [Candidatus Avispirillum sp.]